jgi:uncharacterized protein (DUF885 family)
MDRWKSSIASILLIVLRAPAQAQDLPRGSVAEAVGRLEDRRLAALTTRDFAALDELLAPDLLYCHSNGECQSPQQLRADLASGRLRYERIAPLTRSINAQRALATINATADLDAALHGKPVSMRLQYLAVYARHGGRWRLTAYQSSRMPQPGAATAPAQIAVRRLHALFDATWEQELRDNPNAASALGDARYNDRWTDMSIAALEARHAGDLRTLATLRAIARSDLPPAEQLNYDLFEREYLQRVEVWPFKHYLYDLKPREGIQTLSEIAEVLPFETVKDYEDWIARLNGVGRLVDQHIELLRLAAREGRTQPRVLMERVVPQLALQVAREAQASPFYAPLRRMPAAIAQADRTRLAADARAAIDASVIPAYRRLQRYFVSEFLPATRSSVGISTTPQGEAYYRNRVAFHTTTESLTVEQIHAIGLEEVARIRAAMLAIRDSVGFQGTLQQFFVYLRTDPRFYYGTPKELFEAYHVVAKRIDPALGRLFGKLPRTPFGIREIPPTSAPNTTTAYYQQPSTDGRRPGYYYVNLHRPEARPKYEMEVLTVHEAVPGHHLQIALAFEQPGLPMFRRHGEYTAYVEGWALYSESLGEELGLYQDPYSKFGQLTYDMWRAVRLVVDTGIHAKGWSRQQAIEYFRDNAAKTETDIVNEVDRYISWPGQALAYKVGQLRIRALRAAAEQELGARFDVRAFHDALLASGALPLDVLERQMRAWIEQQK